MSQASGEARGVKLMRLKQLADGVGIVVEYFP
jgi:hypothetical protein